MLPGDLKLVFQSKKKCRVDGSPQAYPTLNTQRKVAAALGLSETRFSQLMAGDLLSMDLQARLEFLFNAQGSTAPYDAAARPDLRANPAHAPLAAVVKKREERMALKALHRRHNNKSPQPDYERFKDFFGTQKEMARMALTTVDAVKNWARRGIPYESRVLLEQKMASDLAQIEKIARAQSAGESWEDACEDAPEDSASL